MTITPAARDLAAATIIAMECSGNLDRYLTAYRDTGGVWTLGAGSTYMPSGRRVRAGDTLTHAQALDLLDDQIGEWATVVGKTITRPLSDPWMAMLVSFVHQEGVGALPGSVLAEMLNAALWDRAGTQLNGWVIATVNGVKQPVLGIMRRMEAQRQIAAGGALDATRARVWQMGEPALRALYDRACTEARAWRNGRVTWEEAPASVPTHTSLATAPRLIGVTPAAPLSTADTLNAGELTRIQQGA